MNPFHVALTIGVSAITNRFRGGGFGAVHVPGRPLFPAALIMGAQEWISPGGSIATASAIGAGYLVWGLPAWGQWFDFGRIEQYRAPQPWEKLLSRLADDRDSLAFFIRQLLVMPGFVVLAGLIGSITPILVGLALAVAIAASYAAAWFANDRGWTTQPITLAELAAGAAWGAAILAA